MKEALTLEAAVKHLEDWTERLMVARASANAPEADMAERLVGAYGVLVTDIWRDQEAPTGSHSLPPGLMLMLIGEPAVSLQCSRSRAEQSRCSLLPHRESRSRTPPREP